MESAKIKALLYADLFDYPLTEEELEKWKIRDGISNISTKGGSASGGKYLMSNIENGGGYYYFKGRKKILALRKKREEISKNKLKTAKKACFLLQKIPFIKMIALTGGLAMQNSRKGDDIDFLIVAQKGTLWLTRLLATLLLDLKGWRRHPNDKNFTNKICLNMFLEEGFLALPKNEQDLYGAHEVCQTKPIFDRDNTYQRFLEANSWVKRFLPKAIAKIRSQELRIRRGQEKPLFIIHYSLFILERLAKFLQLWYMKRHRTIEVITSHMLRFHPKDYRQQILKVYGQKI